MRVDRVIRLFNRAGGQWLYKKEVPEKKKKDFSGVKMDGDHGLAETFLKIRSGLYRKVNFYGRFFFFYYLYYSRKRYRYLISSAFKAIFE